VVSGLPHSFSGAGLKQGHCFSLMLTAPAPVHRPTTVRRNGFDPSTSSGPVALPQVLNDGIALTVREARPVLHP